ncbi:MAG: sulfatase [Kiritimatiellales bacterium]|nr:sulfatase [Kiritimatiellales bacterium]
MKRRNFLATCSAGMALPMFSQAAQRKRPNILFVFADQLRSMELGCYGGTQVHTPNMDRVGREGVLFEHAISSYPVCSPFRAMLMSGNFPMKNGMVYNDHYMRNPSSYFAEVCKANGYRTGYIGKWHIDGYGRENCIPPERRHGFDFWRTLECTHNYFDSKYYYQDETKPRTWDGYDSIAQTAAACEFIKDQTGGDPFCLFLSWGPPHDPYTAPAEYMQRFDPERIVLRENVNDFAAAEKMWNECDTGLVAAHEKIRRIFLPDLKDRSNKAVKKWYQGYYASIEALDDCLGRIFQTLEKQRILDDTLVVFTSDHGDNLGSHRQYGKQLPYEESLSVPFMVRYPERIKPGIKTDALLAPVDIMPTVLALAGVPCPAVDGKDISGAAMGHDADVQDAVLLMRMVWLGTNWITNGSGPWRGVRTKRYTYARKADTRKPWMLFDNNADPQQLNNLVDDPAYAALVKKLNARTDALLEVAGDPEDPIAIGDQIRREQKQLNRPVGTEGLIPTRVVPGSGFVQGGA